MTRKAEYLREENRVLKEALQDATGHGDRLYWLPMSSAGSCRDLVVMMQPPEDCPRDDSAQIRAACSR